MKRAFIITALSALGLSLSGGVEANPNRPAAPVRRVSRDRFQRTVLVGVSVGVGSPRGFAGGFVEFRPVRAFGVSVGGGMGGGFGPALDVSVIVAPVGGISWALGVEGSLSRQFSYGVDLDLPDGRRMPGRSDWLSAGFVAEFRPSRTLMVRFGVGHSWMLNTSDFGIISRSELNSIEANYTPIPGTTPLDAARAALANETLGVWFAHIDFAPSWRW